MDMALTLADHAGFEKRRVEARTRGRLRGLGVANAIEVAGGPYTALNPDTTELRVNPDGSVTLSWTAPGDDWLCGTAESYRVILDDGPIDDPGDGSALPDADAGSTGSAESAELTEAEVDGATHAAVLYRDEAGNWGLLRSVAVPPPGDDGGAGGGGGGDDGPGGPCEHRIRGTGNDDIDERPPRVRGPHDRQASQRQPDPRACQGRPGSETGDDVRQRQPANQLRQPARSGSDVHA